MCLQRAGNLLYLPDGRHHATVSLGESVRLAGQSLHVGPYLREVRVHGDIVY